MLVRQGSCFEIGIDTLCLAHYPSVAKSLVGHNSLVEKRLQRGIQCQ